MQTHGFQGHPRLGHRGEAATRPRSKGSWRWSCAALVVACAFLCAVAASAQEAAGVIAAVEGSAELGRNGTWTDAALGDEVRVGDEVRTGDTGRIRIVFQDESVLNVSESSHLIVDEQVFDPERGSGHSVTKLLSGKIRALVGRYYQQPGTSYEVETATAVAGVRGTEFIVIYDSRRELTEVVGITGRVEVHSLLDRLAHGVFVTSGEITKVPSGDLPEAPQWLEEPEFRQYLGGLEFIGTGRPESLASVHPVVGGTVPEPDRAPPSAGLTAGTVSTTENAPTERNVGNLVGQPLDTLKAVEGGARIRF